MLTEKEKQFLAYWECNREYEGLFLSKLLKGLPMSLVFSLPIILSVVVVKIYIPEWYMKISKTSPGMFITVIFAVLLITMFYSFFRMHFKWENNEQVYKILKLKAEKLNKENQQTIS
ncbi:MAG: hypothetical protein IPP72_19260 [Chitinophagaceae bacterium]|nr:hypothetical protein [Chitinophagaceae bacterium]